MSRAIYFIINPIAGTRKNKRKIIADIISKFKGIDFSIYETQCRGDAVRAARDAVARGYDTVVAVGGDGTVNEVATGLCGTGAALGIVPLGSGNGLARSLHIPLKRQAAFAVILQGHVRAIDMGKAGSRHFCAVSGVGFDAAVSANFDHSRLRGFWSYVWISARELWRFHPRECTVEFDEGSLSCRPFLVTVANSSQYGNGAIIAPQAHMDDGYLDICLAQEIRPRELLAVLPRLFLGTIDKHPKMKYFKTKKVTLHMDRSIQFHVDGEPETTDTELKIEVLERALKVWVPS